jgi:uncharacterized membrane protein
MLNWLFPSYIPDWVQHAVFPLNRWIHIVCTTLLVGGALFYEFVIPHAIEDLKEETQLAVLGRVRWFFRQVVVFSTLLLVISGSLTTYHQWQMYSGNYWVVRPWLYAHIGLGIFALLIANTAVARRRAARHPLVWLRIAFVILLIVIFVAAVTRHVQFMVNENLQRYHYSVDIPP